jgi:hypothetical protein
MPLWCAANYPASCHKICRQPDLSDGALDNAIKQMIGVAQPTHPRGIGEKIGMAVGALQSRRSFPASALSATLVQALKMHQTPTPTDPLKLPCRCVSAVVVNRVKCFAQPVLRIHRCPD